MSRGDLVLGIALGIALGLAIVAVFVFVFSEDAIDSAQLEGRNGQSEPRPPARP